jgi:hypothetical protein
VSEVKNVETAHGSSSKERIIPLTELKEIDDFLERKIRQFDGERPELWKSFWSYLKMFAVIVVGIPYTMKHW